MTGAATAVAWRSRRHPIDDMKASAVGIQVKGATAQRRGGVTAVRGVLDLVNATVNATSESMEARSSTVAHLTAAALREMGVGEKDVQVHPVHLHSGATHHHAVVQGDQ